MTITDLVAFADDNAKMADAYGTISLHDSPDLAVVKYTRPTTFESALYRPAVCLVLQGTKESAVGGELITLSRGDSLIVSHDLPVVSRVIQASAQVPYLALVLDIDMAIVRSLYTQMQKAPPLQHPARSVQKSPSEPSLVDALARYCSLVAGSVEKTVMAPLILTEIHFRLLMASNGAMLRQMLVCDSHASRIAGAIAHIRSHYRERLPIGDLADIARMSPSSFHEHFRAITGTTPLQYQKELRLIHASSLLRDGAANVSSVAFEVGYESPAQFSREYSRKYGTAPRCAIGTASRLMSG